MTQQGRQLAMREAWERASEVYLSRRGNDVATVSYGNLAPTENELRLLDDVRGKRILDFGCGGGQNAIACALHGAQAIGVDISSAQLEAARQLSALHGVSVEWRQGSMAWLAELADINFDVILAIQTLAYLDAPSEFLQQACRLLCPGGRLIVSVDHPFRDCFYDAEMDELVAYPVRSYDDPSPLHWYFDEDLPMQTAHHSIGEWVAWVVASGMTLQKLVEAPAPLQLCDELWPEDSPLAPLRNIPHTLILVATLPSTH